jgi:hypothetical protein
MQTYKFHTKKGERLAIFLHNGKVVIFRCSKDDQFSRKVARRAFYEYEYGIGSEYHPEVIEAPEIKTGTDFFNWCKSRYYVKTKATLPAVHQYLVRPFATISPTKERILTGVSPFTKMAY